MRAWQCIEAQPLDRGGVMLAYGLGKDGRLKHISQVDNGLACRCKCPACDAPLVARHCREDIRDHFAHLSNKGCRYAQESVLHHLAKELLNEHLYLILPGVFAKYGSESELVFGGGRFDFEGAVLEKRLEGVVPDVILRCRGRELLVEIRVTHKCGPEKREKIKLLGLSAIEIDLSDLDMWAPDRELVWSELCSDADREWLNNPRRDEAEEGLKERVERRRAEEAAREDARIQARLNYMREEAARPAGRMESMDVELLRKLRRTRLAQHVGVPIEGDGCFQVGRLTWQGCIVHWLVLECVDDHRARAAWVEELLNSFSEHGFVRSSFDNLGSYLETELKRRDPAFRTPHEVVSAYLHLLAERDVLEKSDRTWRIAGSLKDRLQRRNRVMALREKRRDDVLKRALRLMAGRGYDVPRWFVRALPGYRVSLALVIRSDDDTLFWDIDRKLRAIEAMVDGHGPPVDDLLGMPLENERAARARQIEEEKERVRLEEIEKARRAAEQRALRFREEAAVALRYSERGWIDAPCPALDNKLPADVARESDGGYVTALRAAQREHAARERTAQEERMAAEFLGKLSDRARLVLRRDDLVGMFLNNRHPALNGQCPRTYCRTELTYQKCAALLGRR